MMGGWESLFFISLCTSPKLKLSKGIGGILRRERGWKRMRERKCGDIAGSSRGRYIRNIVDIPELYAIDFGASFVSPI
jgi:hypothetical protein